MPYFGKHFRSAYKFKRHEEILSSLLFSSLLLSSVMIFAQTCTDPVIALIQTGSDCDSYEVRMFSPPTDDLVRLNVTVVVSSNGSNLNATLGSELAAAGGYNLTVSPTNLITVNQTNFSGFQLPSFSGTGLTLFTFSFLGDFGATVDVTIDNSAMIIFFDPVEIIGDECAPTFLNPSASCTFSGGSTLSGKITAIQNCMGSINQSLVDATVTISSTSAPGLTPLIVQTDVAGDYSGTVLDGEDYLVSPEYDLSEPDCGLDDADIVRISGHILGSFPFTNPWEFVAADFNLSNGVTTFDQIGIRNAILNDVYPSGFKSWRMVNAAALSGGVLNGFNLSLIRETATVINAPLSGAPNLNFIGVKTGDVEVSCNQCITTNSLANSVPLAGLKSEIKGDLSEGGIIELRLSPEEAYKELWLIGLEFLLSPEHLEVLEIRGEGGFRLQEEGYAVNAQTGHFHGIWLPLEQQFLELGKDDQLTVRAKVKQPFSTIAEVFSLLSGANIYPDGNKRSWSMSPQQHSKIVVFPNPFGGQFTINGTVEVGQLRVFNAAGQLIHQQQLQPLVEHQIIAHNWQPGVYFYRVETPSATTTGKLIRK